MTSELWERIKYKTTFMVDFDANKLIECAAIAVNVNVPKADTSIVTGRVSTAVVS